MDLLFLLKLSENDKRVIIAILLVVIILFVIIGLLGSLTIKIMRWQGKKCDTLVSDVVRYHIITRPSELKRYARVKNIRYFIVQAWVPIVIILVGLISLFIQFGVHNAIPHDWNYSFFGTHEDEFGSILFYWDFSTFGLNINNWKPELTWPAVIHEPAFSPAAIPSYITAICFLVGGIWYFVIAQAYLARTIRAYVLSKKVFEKSLDDFDQNKPMPTETLETAVPENK